MNHEVGMLAEIIIGAGVLAAGARYLFSRRTLAGKGISIIIPFRCVDPDDQRVRNFEWLKAYWQEQLPAAEIIVGEDPSDCPFSKSVAVNNGVAESTGDILVIVDADGYISADKVLYVADEIRDAQERGQRLWFVPYRQFYRLTEAASAELLDSDPADPLEFPEPLPSALAMGDNDPRIGHWYGAAIQICSREAFDIVGGWDERFRGWGGEDAAATHAMDTLYAPHKTLPGQVLHVWHPQLGPQGKAAQISWKERMWDGQSGPGANDWLSMEYYAAYRRPERMRKLVNAGIEFRHHDPCGRHHHGHHHEHHHHRHHHHRHHHHHHRPSV
jgi:Glycosyltransferase like family 2